ncbi:basal-body rod modification protein FlgD [mine drainage metagenome]|uniref:Basal-body rod modification protein FlgD n=1 Tax=mine drainage metagenome TaxID=410659 RepID=A0A1J5QM96_9ZZZZ
MVSAVANTSSAAGAATSSVASATQAQQDQFLKLLVTQLQNQDPMNPMDNAAITTQMAQLSTVQGISQLNATMTAFAQSQSYQSVGMIGHNILAPGNTLSLAGGKGMVGVEMAGAADKVQVNISDANGALVKTINLGAQTQAGIVPVTWDGTTNSGGVAPDGNYTFSVTGMANGAAISPTGLSVGLVQSVVMNATGPSLSVQGMGMVDLSQVKQII